MPILGIMASQISGHLSPIPLTNLKLWLDASVASSITSSGGRVSQWNDLSAQGNNVVQATASYKPETGAATINGLNALRFNNATLTEKMESNGAASIWAFMSNATGCTIFSVGKYDNSVDGWLISTYNGSGSIAGIIHYINGSLYPTNYVGGTGATAAIAAINAVSVGTTNAFSFTSVNDPSNATASARNKIYLNSTAATQNNTNTAAFNTGTPSYTLTIGNTGINAGPFKGTVGEVIVYSGQLSGTDISTVQTYLKTKWGTP